MTHERCWTQVGSSLFLGGVAFPFITKHLGHNPNGLTQEWAYQDMAHSNQSKHTEKDPSGLEPSHQSMAMSPDEESKRGSSSSDLKYKAIRRLEIFRNQMCGYNKNLHIVSHIM
ncbi:hypothetical protein HanIR_Chr05g0227631 [Helianthus annuus]|nr:hypothetical protein HanIR_Chr05g0227631 [Helianthus annuus]